VEDGLGSGFRRMKVWSLIKASTIGHASSLGL